MTIRVVKNYRRKPVRVRNSAGKNIVVPANGTAHLDSSFPEELPAGLAIIAAQGVPTQGVRVPEQDVIAEAPVFLSSETELNTDPKPVIDPTQAEQAGQVEVNDELLSEEDGNFVEEMVEETVDDDQDENFPDEPNVTTSEDLLKK